MTTAICDGPVDGSCADFTWRFALDPQAADRREPDPLIEMVRAYLEDFLTIGFVTVRGERVQPDGFAFANEPKRIYSIFHDNAGAGPRPDALEPLRKHDGG